MKVLIHCPLCKGYHYSTMIESIIKFDNNMPIKTIDKFKCSNCNKEQTNTRETKSHHV